MDEHIFDKIDEVDLKKTMEKSYIEYAIKVPFYGGFFLVVIN